MLNPEVLSKNIIEPLADNTIKTAHVYRQFMIDAMLGAVVLLVSLAWNAVIQEVIAIYYPKEKYDNQLKGKVIYALIITFIVLLLQIYLFPLLTNNKQYIKEYPSTV